VIELQQLTKRFGDSEVVRGLTFDVAEGTVLGFLGPNGAGKSTTMKMITGFLEPSAGCARIYGHDVVAERQSAQSMLGYLPEGAPSYEDMTPQSFLRFIAEIRGFQGRERDDRVAAVAEELSIDHVLHQRIETLSKGFKRRVGLAQAILHDPRVLILDEPTDGLDPNQKRQVRDMIKGLAADKIVVISTHILEEVAAVCTRAIIINEGEVVLDEEAESLTRRAEAHGVVSLTINEVAADEIKASCQQLGPNVAIVSDAPGRYRLKGYVEGGGLAPALIGLAQEKGWHIADFEQEGGALDSLFAASTGAKHV